MFYICAVQYGSHKPHVANGTCCIKHILDFKDLAWKKKVKYLMIFLYD